MFLNKIKLLLGLTGNDKDKLLTYLIECAQDEAMNYTHNDNLYELENAICQMVVFNYNSLGSENLSSEGYSGVSYAYRNDYPESILRQLKAHRKVVFK